MIQNAHVAQNIHNSSFSSNLLGYQNTSDMPKNLGYSQSSFSTMLSNFSAGGQQDLGKTFNNISEKSEYSIKNTSYSTQREGSKDVSLDKDTKEYSQMSSTSKNERSDDGKQSAVNKDVVGQSSVDKKDVSKTVKNSEEKNVRSKDDKKKVDSNDEHAAQLASQTSKNDVLKSLKEEQITAESLKDQELDEKDVLHSSKNKVEVDEDLLGIQAKVDGNRINENSKDVKEQDVLGKEKFNSFTTSQKELSHDLTDSKKDSQFSKNVQDFLKQNIEENGKDAKSARADAHESAQKFQMKLENADKGAESLSANFGETNTSAFVDLANNKTQGLNKVDVLSQKAFNQLQKGGSDALVQQAKLVLQDGGRGQIKLQLTPKELGEVKLTVQLDSNNAVHAKAIVSSEAARDAMQRNLGDMAREFQQEGYALGSFSVSVDSNDSQGNEFENQEFNIAQRKKDFSLIDSSMHNNARAYIQTSTEVNFVA